MLVFVVVVLVFLFQADENEHCIRTEDIYLTNSHKHDSGFANLLPICHWLCIYPLLFFMASISI